MLKYPHSSLSSSASSSTQTGSDFRLRGKSSIFESENGRPVVSEKKIIRADPRGGVEVDINKLTGEVTRRHFSPIFTHSHLANIPLLTPTEYRYAPPAPTQFSTSDLSIYSKPQLKLEDYIHPQLAKFLENEEDETFEEEDEFERVAWDSDYED